ncbi:enoyl-CoA hydratase/isomerase family protein [Microbulbifer hainanensis]|uniref:enoyl-CoA hydratase/isomerase family protein n=1 Tax=Microbulbifer hainanensis TaxID=2735675 RepID=UPI001866EAA1|nr:enoyl-CoA hydratase-related protein [Microbulbifer hainanensis]
METLIVEQQGSARLLTLNRPQQRNAMNLQMVEDLLQQLATAEADEQIRALVLRGSSGHFCAGGDIADMLTAQQRAADGDSDAFYRMNRHFGELLSRFNQTNLVVVAALEGAVMGGGFGLACIADICLAAQGARFALPETRLGLPPAQIAPFVATRLGQFQARRLALSGVTIDTEEAARIGLVHAIAESGEALTDSVNQQLQAIHACAPNALATTKQLLRDSAGLRDSGLEALLDSAARQFADAMQRGEGREGARAFIEKRPAEWQQA